MTEIAARATMAIAQCTQNATTLTPAQGSLITSNQSSTQSQAPMQQVTAPADSQMTPPLGESTTSFDTSSQSESHLTPATQPEDSSDMQPTRSLSESHKTVISEVFGDMISSNVTVRLPEIRGGMRDSIPLRSLLLVPGMDRKVADRVRHCQSVTPRSLPEIAQGKEELVQSWREDCSTVSLDTVSSSRKAWSQIDSAILEERLQKVSKCPTKAELKSIMEVPGT